MASPLAYRRYRLPFRVALRTARGIWREREGHILRWEDGAGVVRYAEVAPVPEFGPENVAADEAILRRLGADPSPEAIAAIPAELGALRAAFGFLFADPGEPRAEAMGVAALLPAGRSCLERVGAKVEMGFRVFKWKVGVLAAADERIILDDLCARLPAGAKLRLDANGAWDRRTAEAWLNVAADRPIEYVEQPIGPAVRGVEDLLQGLAADYPTPLALDESLVGAPDVAQWLERGWKGVFVIKPSLIGDFPGVLARLEAAKARVVFSTALETLLGAQAGLRAAFAWKGEPLALGFGVWPLFEDARWDGPPSGPFLRWSDVDRPVGETLWTALT